MKRSRFSDSQIMAVLKQAEGGVPVAELCREHDVSSATFYKWRSKFGWHGRGDDVSAEGPRGRESSVEEDVRRRSVTQGRAPGGDAKKVVRPSRRRERAKRAVSEFGLSIRLSCATFSISETCYRYQSRLSSENARVADWLIRLTSNQRNGGFGLCYLFLRNVKRFGWNHKRV